MQYMLEMSAVSAAGHVVRSVSWVLCSMRERQLFKEFVRCGTHLVLLSPEYTVDFWHTKIFLETNERLSFCGPLRLFCMFVLTVC